MPLSWTLTASPRAVPNVVTTTVFAGGAPTAASPGSGSSSSSSPLPIAAIVGGLVGGIFIAVAAVGMWVWWGKSLEKKQRKKPRLRSALKKNGRSTPSVNASKHSLPRHHPARDAMGSFSQKSVSFAPVPSTTTSEDSDSRNTPSPAAEDMEDKGKKTPRVAIHEQGAASSTTGSTWPRHSPPPSRSALRPPSSLRGQSTDRAYVPARPSPLARATLTSDAHPIVDASPQPPLPPPSVQQDLAPPRQLSTLDPANRSSDISVPSEYSQEGTASDVEPFRMLRAPDERLYPHRETEELSCPDVR